LNSFLLATGFSQEYIIKNQIKKLKEMCKYYSLAAKTPAFSTKTEITNSYFLTIDSFKEISHFIYKLKRMMGESWKYDNISDDIKFFKKHIFYKNFNYSKFELKNIPFEIFEKSYFGKLINIITITHEQSTTQICLN